MADSKENLPEVKKNELPKIQDLVSDIVSYNKNDKLNFLLNQPVPKKWITKHPIIKKTIINEKGQNVRVPYEYLPIDKVEYLLRKIFKEYKIEILGQGMSFNGVYVTVRVWYKDVISGDWKFHDGIGASQLQTKKGTSPTDYANINNGALSMAYPLAKTLAIKDACDMFGKLFGSDLNRRDTQVAIMDSKKTDDEILEEIKLLLEVEGLTIAEDERNSVERIVADKEVIKYKMCIELLNKHLPKVKK